MSLKSAPFRVRDPSLDLVHGSFASTGILCRGRYTQGYSQGCSSSVTSLPFLQRLALFINVIGCTRSACQSGGTVGSSKGLFTALELN